MLCRSSHQGKDAGYADVRRMPDGRIAFRNKWGGVQYVKSAVTVRTSTDSEEAPFGSNG